jgi:mediator of RNA polymerase II transcription subunit 5
MEFFGKLPVEWIVLRLCHVVTIISSTRPKMLLAIAATVFLHALRAAVERKLELDTLNNGITYFLGPLLGWTLPGIVLALVRQIRMTRWKQVSRPRHYEY